MEMKYAVRPETFKPVAGAYWAQNPSMLDGAPRAISLCCARADTAAAQIQLCCDEPYVVNLSEGAALTPSGRLNIIRAAAPRGCRLSFVLMHPCDDRFTRGDALDTRASMEFAAGETCTLYAEFTVGRDEDAGEREYTVELLGSVMFGDEEKLGEIAVSLRVYDFIIPDKKDFAFHLDIWQHNCAVARAHRVPAWSDAHFAILDRYAASLAALGQKAVTVIASDCPWSGQWCHLEYRCKANLYEYSIIHTRRSADGVFTYDYTDMQRYIDLCAAHGIDREITVFGLVNVWCDTTGGFDALAPDDPDGAKIRYLDEADGTYKYMRRGADIDAYIAALEQYFVRTGQIDRVRLMADEPADIERYRASIERVGRVAPRFILKAAMNHAEFIPEFGNRVSDFVPNLESWSREYDRIAEYKATMPGKRFLWYVCNEPTHPNTLLKSDLCETLFMGVLTALFRMDGFLRWGYTVWCDDPVADNRYFTWPVGDLNFVYPSPSGEPMLSLRWKALRRAVELCELIGILRAEKGDAAADRAFEFVVRAADVRGFFRDGKPVPLAEMCSCDYADYAALREYVLSALTAR